jgi:hypothetical protein
MNKNPKLISLRFILALAAGLAASNISSHAQSGTASLSGVPATGGFNYTLTLNNTGATVFNSFWYGWTTGGDNLPSVPSGATNNLGWGNLVSGNSIMWINSTGTALASGHSGVFGFFSTSTPTQMTAGIAGESVAYVNGIDFSQGVPGSSTGIITPSLVVPEPSSFALLMAGSLGLLAAGWRKLRT